MSSLYLKLSVFITVSIMTSIVYGQSPWENLTPLKGLNVLSCSYVVDDTTAFVGGPTTVLLRTTNHGELWTNTISNSLTGVVGLYFFNPQNGLLAGGGGSMFTTNDGGLTWTQSYTSSYAFQEMVFTSSSEGFICGSNGLLIKTTDAGANWSVVPTGVTSLLYDISFASPTTAYMSSNNGEVLKSVDGGSTWSIIYSGLPPYLTALAFVGDTGFVACLNQGLYRTTDGGVSWSSITVPASSYVTEVHFTEPDIVYALGWNGLILRSENAGGSFTQIPSPISVDIKGILKFPSGVLNMYGQRSLMESFDNGLTWKMRLRGIDDSKLQRIRFSNDSTAHCVGSYQNTDANSTILRTDDNGRYWSTKYSSSSSSTGYWDISFANDSVGFISGQGEMRKTTNRGLNWVPSTRPLQNRAVFCVDANNILVGNLNNGIYRSSNGGTSWNLVYAPSTYGVTRFSFLNNQIGLAGITTGIIAKTTDAGLTWTEIYDPLLPVSQIVDIDFVNDTLAYSLNISSNLYKSTDAGLTWSSVGYIIGTPMEILVPDPSSPDSMYCLTLSGNILKSIDGGSNWTVFLLNSMSSTMQVYDFVIHHNTFYACGINGDIFRSKFNCVPALDNRSIAVCNESQLVLPDGQVIESPGIYTYRIYNPHDCDSIITASITFHNSVTVQDTVDACTSFTWNANGQIYTNSGNYTAIVSTTQGCDSIIELNLTITPPYTSNSTITACDEYLWSENGLNYTSSGIYTETYTSQNGCDSLISLDLTINTSSSSVQNVTTCETYIWPTNGQSYSASGIYIDTLSGIYGCDSIISLNLVIDNVDTSVFLLNDSTLIGVSGADSYQWLDCSNGYEILIGESNIVLDVTENGLYALEITSGTCVDTSSCYSFDITSGLNELSLGEGMYFYPNPTSGQINVNLNGYEGSLWLRQMSITGVLIQEYYFPVGTNVECKLREQAGIYRIQLQLESGRLIERAVVLIR